MEKSFEIRFPFESDYENLKKLWQTAFDDTAESLDFFFENTVSPDRVLVAFDSDKPVSALYMLESDIVIDDKEYSAYYIYAVCTHPDFRGKGLMRSLFEKLFEVSKSRNIDYLFLVPEEEYLFKLYERLGFKNGFSYSQKILLKRDYKDVLNIENQKLTYETYRKCIEENKKDVPLAVLKETTFNSFFNSVSGEVKSFFVENEGYALCEDTEENITVYELSGNEELLLNVIFQNTEKESLIYRQIADLNPISYGMFYKIKDVPEIVNGFFGIPYSN